MTDLLVVLFVALLVFGATKVPAVGDALGRALRGRGGATRRDAPGTPPGGISDRRSPPP